MPGARDLSGARPRSPTSRYRFVAGSVPRQPPTAADRLPGAPRRHRPHRSRGTRPPRPVGHAPRPGRPPHNACRRSPRPAPWKAGADLPDRGPDTGGSATAPTSPHRRRSRRSLPRLRRRTPRAWEPTPRYVPEPHLGPTSGPNRSCAPVSELFSQARFRRPVIVERRMHPDAHLDTDSPPPPPTSTSAEGPYVAPGTVFAAVARRPGARWPEPTEVWRQDHRANVRSPLRSSARRQRAGCSWDCAVLMSAALLPRGR